MSSKVLDPCSDSLLLLPLIQKNELPDLPNLQLLVLPRRFLDSDLPLVRMTCERNDTERTSYIGPEQFPRSEELAQDHDDETVAFSTNQKNPIRYCQTIMAIAFPSFTCWHEVSRHFASDSLQIEPAPSHCNFLLSNQTPSQVTTPTSTVQNIRTRRSYAGHQANHRPEPWLGRDP